MTPDHLADLYDAAPLAMRLQGGPYDGERVVLPQREWPLRWLMPDRSDPAAMYSRTDAPDLDPLGVSRWPVYDYTDSVNDQGERIYRYKGDH
ncbi:hypothetical protein [Nonomuraea sp. NPDC049129]|uniref:hypothetical protein n=1 Tax=Nonomuraea sp. NPDC049129 TaxID=3155272 RepID=UPI0033D4F12C